LDLAALQVDVALHLLPGADVRPGDDGVDAGAADADGREKALQDHGVSSAGARSGAPGRRWRGSGRGRVAAPAVSDAPGGRGVPAVGTAGCGGAGQAASRSRPSRSASSASAASAPSPSAVRVTVSPCPAPRAITPSRLRASTGAPPCLAMVTGTPVAAAALTNRPAGRACRPTAEA